VLGLLLLPLLCNAVMLIVVTYGSTGGFQPQLLCLLQQDTVYCHNCFDQILILLLALLLLLLLLTHQQGSKGPDAERQV
jgi:hypothetical protein